MRRGKYQTKRKSYAIWIILSIAILSVSFGGARAYLLHSSDEPLVNSFSTDINPVITVDDDYSVSVTSSAYPVYLRAAVVVYWRTVNENVLADVPSGYTLETSDEWKFHNGFYYYCQPVQVGSDIPPVITKLVAPVEGQSGTGVQRQLWCQRQAGHAGAAGVRRAGGAGCAGPQ